MEMIVLAVVIILYFAWHLLRLYDDMQPKHKIIGVIDPLTGRIVPGRFQHYVEEDADDRQMKAEKAAVVRVADRVLRKKITLDAGAEILAKDLIRLVTTGDVRMGLAYEVHRGRASYADLIQKCRQRIEVSVRIMSRIR